MLAAESQRLAQEQARRVVARIWKIRLLGFAVRKAGGARGVMQAEALQQLRIIIELAALP